MTGPEIIAMANGYRPDGPGAEPCVLCGGTMYRSVEMAWALAPTFTDHHLAARRGSRHVCAACLFAMGALATPGQRAKGVRGDTDPLVFFPTKGVVYLPNILAEIAENGLSEFELPCVFLRGHYQKHAALRTVPTVDPDLWVVTWWICGQIIETVVVERAAVFAAVQNERARVPLIARIMASTLKNGKEKVNGGVKRGRRGRVR